MKVRIGFGLGTRTHVADDGSFTTMVDELERLGFDSLWLSEQLSGPCPDPLVAMTWAAARTTKLKFGTAVMVLPGRNPMLTAVEMATLDRLSEGRLLPAFGLGQVNAAEQQAFGVERADRAPMFDELLPLLRRLWTEDGVDHEGRFFSLRDATVHPKPVQQPIDVWLGGRAPSELRRCGRLGDGWLPSFCVPADVVEGRHIIEATAAEHDREIEDEHYGALVPYLDGEIPDVLAAFLHARRPDLDPGDVIATSMPDLHAKLEAFCEVGASKFVVVPVVDPTDWAEHLGAVADGLFDLQN